MQPKRWALAACLTLVMLASEACTTIGGGFGESISQLKPGVTTEPQAVALLGPPTESTPSDHGMTKVIWARVSDPNDSIRHTRTVTVLFGPDGKLSKVDSRSNAYNIVDRKAAPGS